MRLTEECIASGDILPFFFLTLFSEIEPDYHRADSPAYK